MRYFFSVNLFALNGDIMKKRKVTVNIPDIPGKITLATVKGIRYVRYETGRIYHPERKNTTPVRVTIGRAAEEDGMMYPNDKYREIFPKDSTVEIDNNLIERSDLIKTGTWIVLAKAMEANGLYEWMRKHLGDNDGGLLLDFASYQIICEANEAQHYPDYAWEHPLFTGNMNIYSDSKISEFFRSSLDINIRQAFFSWWTGQRDKKELIYISYDSTNKNSQAGELEIVEFGHAKDDEDKPIFNWAIAHDMTNSVPLFYEEYLGSIVDVSQLSFMIERAKSFGFEKVGFILDRGYFAKPNIQFMDENGYDYILMMKGNKELVSSLVMENRNTFEEKSSCFIPQYATNGITVEKRLYGDSDRVRYVHLYFSSSRYNADRTDLEEKLAKVEDILEKHLDCVISYTPKSFVGTHFCIDATSEGRLISFSRNNERIDRETALCGYFCIITSARMSAHDALILYKNRDESEKLFRSDKTFLGGRSMRVHSQPSLDNKLFITFIALIIRSWIHKQIVAHIKASNKTCNWMNVPSLIKELEKITMLRDADGRYRLNKAITKRNREVLAIFGLDENQVNAKVRELSDKLFSADQNIMKQRKNSTEANENDNTIQESIWEDK